MVGFFILAMHYSNLGVAINIFMLDEGIETQIDSEVTQQVNRETNSLIQYRLTLELKLFPLHSDISVQFSSVQSHLLNIIKIMLNHHIFKMN